MDISIISHLPLYKHITKTSNAILKAFNNNHWVYSKPQPQWNFPIYHPRSFQTLKYSHCSDWNEEKIFFSPQAVTSFHLPTWDSSYVTKGYTCKSEYRGISWVEMNCYCNAAAPSNVQENSYYDEANIASPPKNSLISKLFTR